MANTFRKRDMAVEREIAAYLDEKLYSQEIFSSHTRTNGQEEQFSGSDIILTIPTKNLNNIIVDEKAQSQYMVNPLPTFSLELSFMNRANEWQEGWFWSEKHKTQYYLFCWPRTSEEKKWNATKDDILELEYALVSREKLQQYFISQGLTKENLQKKDAEIRKSNQYGAHDKTKDKDYWFFFSTNLAEKPINIILRKKIYIELSELHGIIK